MKLGWLDQGDDAPAQRDFCQFSLAIVVVREVNVLLAAAQLPIRG